MSAQLGCTRGALQQATRLGSSRPRCRSRCQAQRPSIGRSWRPGNRPALLCPAQGPESSGPAALDGKAPSGSAGPVDSGSNGPAPSTSGSGDKEALKESLFRETDAPDTLQMEGRFGGVELAIATSFIEKVAGALVMYGVTMLLAGVSNVDATKALTWDDGAPLVLGASFALPVALGMALLFLPDPRPSPPMSAKDLKAIRAVDSEDEDTVITLGGSGGAPFDAVAQGERLPPMTPQALTQGLWFYQVNVLKPWYPPFEWGTVGFLYMASCAAASAQELLVRGYGGQVLAGWWTGLLAGATDPSNPLYWAKVFKLVGPDTSRWMAALTLLVLQVSLTSASASRAARFTRVCLNRLGRVEALPGTRGVVVQDVSISLELGGGAASKDKAGKVTPEPKLDQLRTVYFELPTAEERVVYWTSLGVAAALCGTANLAYAVNGSLLASYTAQVTIDGLVTALQQWKATRLPDRQGWEELQEEEDAKIAQLEESLGAAADKPQSAEETGKGPEAKEKD
ncbi:hypothetical protein CHLRE_02g098650v5 [Chlamydomonas reinhardtii]|uniref:Uncharacterized protein n=1 Tax=Chlamydomonas reinhardtii TaxID=3055 RepID=A8I217_CHLRE|nr:uncharacterized protein CHLRE_02g098650v5 [Chlamydomonas reinhardtii]PNW86858.1 hypothetical protein CHLRE_02g098650v5 [Chlamydomonas reinhardtii]|eukprot:XP_001699829.1 predicted protein [Chlamydomonas reinhardtii]